MCFTKTNGEHELHVELHLNLFIVVIKLLTEESLILFLIKWLLRGCHWRNPPSPEKAIVPVPKPPKGRVTAMSAFPVYCIFELIEWSAT